MYLFVLLLTSHGVVCSPEFVLFNSAIIFVLLFALLMIWVEETEESLILVVTGLRKDKNLALDDYGMNLVTRKRVNC